MRTSAIAAITPSHIPMNQVERQADPKSTELETTGPVVNSEVIGKLDLLEQRS